MVFYLINWKKMLLNWPSKYTVYKQNILFWEKTVIILNQSHHWRAEMKLEVLHTKKEYERDIALCLILVYYTAYWIK